MAGDLAQDVDGDSGVGEPGESGVAEVGMCAGLRPSGVYRPCRSKWMDVNTATLARRAQGSKGLLM